MAKTTLLFLACFITLSHTTATTRPTTTKTFTHIQCSFTPLPLLPPPPPPPLQLTQDSTQQPPQFNTIINSIVGAGYLSNWADLLSQTDPSMLPLSATIFIPDDTAFCDKTSSSTSTTTTTASIAHHIIPHRLTISDLLQFPIGARLPSLLPGETLLITNISAVNFTINSPTITHPGLLRNVAVTIHGVSLLLDYIHFGKDPSPPQKQPEMATTTPPEQNPSSPIIKVSTNGAAMRVLSLSTIGGLLLLCFYSLSVLILRSCQIMGKISQIVLGCWEFLWMCS